MKKYCIFAVAVIAAICLVINLNLLAFAVDTGFLKINNQEVSNISITGENDGITIGNNSYKITAKDSSSTSCNKTTYTGKTIKLTFTNNYNGWIKITYTIDGNGTLSAGSNCTVENGVITVQSNGTFTIAVKSSDNNGASSQGSKTSEFKPTAIEYEPLTPLISFAAPAEHGTFSVKDASGSTVAVPGSAESSQYTLTASPASGYAVFRWVFTNANGAVSYFGEKTNSLSYTASEAGTITCEFMRSGSALYTVNDVKYAYLDKAIAATNNSGKVVLAATGSAFAYSGTEIIIPNGVTLVLPYAAGQTTVQSSNADFPHGNYAQGTGFSQQPGTLASSKYLELTIPSGTTVKNNGVIAVGGTLQGNATPSGAHSNLVVNGTLELKSSTSVLSCCGFVYGSGSVVANGSGAKIYQPMSLHRNASWGWAVANTGQSMSSKYGMQTKPADGYNGGNPSPRYSTQNIQCRLQMKYGDIMYGYADQASDGKHYMCNIVLIGKDAASSLIALSTGASLTATYDATNKSTLSAYNNIGKLTLDITGGATQGTISLEMQGWKLQLKSWPFPVPYNYDIILRNGTYNLQHDISFLPGAGLKVAEGATLNVPSNIHLAVFTGANDHSMGGVHESSSSYNNVTVSYKASPASPNYPANSTLSGPSGGSMMANFVVDGGTLDVKSGGYFGGIIQTTGSGNIIMNGVTEQTSGKDYVFTRQLGLTGLVADTDLFTQYWKMAGATIYKFYPQYFDANGELKTMESGMTYGAMNGENNSVSTYTFDLYTNADDVTAKETKTETINATAKGQWKILAVTFDANADASEITGEMAEQPVGYNTAVALNENKFEREGYVFNGWNTAADGSGTTYADKAEIKITKAITLYAQWKRNGFALTLNPNGGQVDPSTASITNGKTYGEAFESGVLPTATRVEEGKIYRFDGWFTAADGGEQIKDDTTVAVTEATTIFAHWTEMFTVSFNSNGGSDVDPQEIASGEVAAEPTAPTKDGSYILGWFTDEALENPYDFATPVTANITLYAKWEGKADPAAENFTVTGPEDLVYSGSAKNVTVTVKAGIEGMGEVTVKYFDDSNSEIAAEDVKNVGTYTYKIFVAEGEYYNAAENHIIEGSFTIAAKEVTPEVTLSANEFVYDGSEKKPAVTLKDGEAIIPAEEYSVAYSNNTDAGTATVTVTDKNGGNYNFAETTATFTIKNADRAAPAVAVTDETIFGKKDGKVTGLTDEMEWSTDNNTWTKVDGTEKTDLAVGTYYVRYAEKANFNASPAATVTIAAGRMLVVTWIDGDGKTVETDEVAYNATAEYNGETPTKTATAQYSYTFTGWDKALDAVTEDVTYTALFSSETRSYTVKFVDEDGTVLKSDTLLYGTEPTAPADPAKEADAQYTYTFAGWDNKIATVTGDATYKATYNTTVNKYTINFVDEDGTTVLQSAEVEYGTIPAFNGTPSKVATAEFTYTFSGWSPAVVAVSGDATYTATYTATKNTYTVTWVVNGVETKETYEYGATPEFKGSTAKEPSGHDEFTFTGWSSEVVIVTENVTYTAQHKTSRRECYDDPNDSDHLCEYGCGENIESCTEGAPEIKNEVAVTCTADGSYDTVVYCSVCHAELSRKTATVPATGHAYEGKETTAPTCTEKGVMTYTCKNDASHTYTEEIAEKGHTLTQVDAKAASCEAIGWNAYEECSVCDYSTYAEIPAAGHAYEGKETTAPTCTDKGVMTYTCKNDASHTYTEEIAEKGHTLTQVEAKAASCEAIGWNAYEECSVCDYSTYAEIPATGHAYEGKETTAPTCTDKGVMTYTCKNDASHTYTEEIAEKGHTLTQVDAKAASCEAIGWNAYEECSVCDYTTYAEIPATGHAYEGKETTAPTCTDKGVMTYTCKNDASHTYTEEIAANGHTLTQVDAKAASCEAIGWNAYEECSVCDYTTYAEIPATGHAYEGKETTAPTCTEKGVMTYTCKNDASHTYTEEIAEKGHTLTQVDAKAASCEAIGWNAYEECSVCDYSTYAEIPATGHTAGEAKEENRVEPNYNAAGSYDMVVRCTVCNEVLSSKRHEISMLEGEAKVGNTNYGTLAEAVEAADENDTIIVLKDIVVEDVVDAGAKTIDFNGHRVKGNVFGTLKMNNGTLVTAEDYEMAGPNGVYYKTTDAVFTMDAQMNIEVIEGTLTLEQDVWWTLPNQTLVIGKDATFVIPKGKTMQVRTNVEVEGTVVVDGVANLHDADATIQTTKEIENITTTVADSCVWYENGKYVVKSHSYTEKVTTDPTCTVEGVKTFTCQCGDTYTEAIAAKGHTLTQVDAKAASCEAIGWNAYEECSVCDYSTYAEIPATGHDYEGKETTAPTCTDKGVMTYTCKNDASHTYTEEIAEKGHTLTQVEAKAASCEAIGWNTHEECSVCDYTTYAEIPATGHDYEGKETTAPTCTEKGVMTYTCKNDASHTYTEEIAEKGHTLTQVDAKAPTCTEAGYEAYEYCSVCDYTTFAEVGVTDHSYVNGFCACGGYEPAKLNDGIYEISNAGQLYWFAAVVNSGYGDVAQDTAANAKLTNNIVVNEAVLAADGSLNEGEYRPWTPIGTEAVPYAGNFDGNSCSISGLFFSDDTADYVGLIGCAADSTQVLSLGIVDSYFHGGKYVGAVAGWARYVTDCYNEGTITGKTYVGGVAGWIAMGGSVKYSHNVGMINGGSAVGGVVGGSASSGVWNSWNSGEINGSSQVGGILGYVKNGGAWYCYNTADVRGTSIAVGGIVGYQTYNGGATNCYNSGAVHGNDYVGGILGYSEAQKDTWIHAENCYNIGMVSGADSANAVGAIVGHTWDALEDNHRNNYYLEGTANVGVGTADEDVAGVVAVMRAEQFASGEVTWMLNSGDAENLSWFQTCGEGYPAFNGLTVYQNQIGGCTEESYTFEYANESKAAVKSHKEETLTAVEPDCVNTGLTEGKYCSVCNEILVAQEAVDALGHDEVKHDAKAPTCTEIGWDEYVTCSRCDYTTYAEIPATGHAYEGKETTAPTCTDKGVMTYTCKNDASHTYTEEIAANGHTLTQVDAKAASCEAVGWNAYEECSVCDYSTYAEIPAAGHAYEGKETTAPTCTEKGVMTYTCKNDASHTYTEEIAANGHTLTQVDAKAATCEAIGWNAYEECSVCDYTTYAEIPATGHTNGDVVKENEAAATCTTDGGYDDVVYCTVCSGEVSRETITIPAPGHSYENGSCTACGAADPDAPIEEFEPVFHNGSGGSVVEIGTAANGAKTYRFQAGTNQKSAPYVTVTAPEGGWKLGEENVFVVESDNDIACVVLVRLADGTYKRVKAVTDENGTHSFTTSDLSENGEIIVAVKGDISGDGLFNATDVNRARLASGGKFTLTSLAKEFADITGDGKFNATDVNRIRLISGGKFALSW